MTAPALAVPAPAMPQSIAVRIGRALAGIACAALFALPLLAALPLSLLEGSSPAAWAALAADPQLPAALALSIFTALASSGLALVLALALVTHLHGSRHWQRMTSRLGPMLALPHAAFAIGLAWLLAPAGWLARAVAPLAGWDVPPPWATVNDPRGLSLVLVLVLKELPFLLWHAAALFARPEVAAVLAREIAVARTLGYGARSWWWRVGWAQWLPRLAWPLLAVLAYSLTVVDLALIIGPGSPPTLAVLAWQGLSDANVARNAEGAAAALLLTLTLAALVATAAAVWRLALRPLWRAHAVRGDRKAGAGGAPSRWLRGAWLAVVAIYLAVLLTLVTMSAAGAWTFPAFWPRQWTLQSWAQVADSARTVVFTAGLALAAAVAALMLSIAWLEAAPARWDRWLTPLVLAPLVLPQLLLLVGLYRGALWLGLDGSVTGLAWVHLLMALPYVFTATAPAWRSFDRRYEWTALALGRRRLAFWWRVKWPLLAAPMASALAIGFAVSVAQYLATQFIGAGRHPTLTTEAVTLASGGQRNVAAAFALLQALLPALGFLAAHAVARRGMVARPHDQPPG